MGMNLEVESPLAFVLSPKVGHTKAGQGRAGSGRAGQGRGAHPQANDFAKGRVVPGQRVPVRGSTWVLRFPRLWKGGPAYWVALRHRGRGA